jgi:glycosyltransferase involved in cell wall biosynthesis
MPDLKRYVEANGLEQSVVFAGAVPHEKVAPYLKLIDIAVQPAANEYCCPMKIIEYMGLGKPVVAPRQENIEELLREGAEALFFAPGDRAALANALATLVANAAQRQQMGAAALAAIHERGYLWTRNAERVIDLVTGG